MFSYSRAIGYMQTMDLIFFCPGGNIGESHEYFERGRESKGSKESKRSKRTTTRGDIANGDPEFVRTYSRISSTSNNSNNSGE